MPSRICIRGQSFSCWAIRLDWQTLFFTATYIPAETAMDMALQQLISHFAFQIWERIWDAHICQQVIYYMWMLAHTGLAAGPALCLNHSLLVDIHLGLYGMVSRVLIVMTKARMHTTWITWGFRGWLLNGQRLHFFLWRWRIQIQFSYSLQLVTIVAR